jgi:adenylyl-sulfate kinase
VAGEEQQAGSVVWLCGLSGAGKTTLADGLHATLMARGIASVVLDGDQFRRGVSADLGFSAADRHENLRRAAEVAALLANTGLVAIAAFISPKEMDRDMIRRLVTERAPGARFSAVYLSASLAVCERRDVKNLYARARAGQINHFTGVSDPFEPPAASDLTLDTGTLSREEALSRLEHHVLATLIAVTVR